MKCFGQRLSDECTGYVDMLLLPQENGRYGELFAATLRSFNILCIGLYRFRDTTAPTDAPPCPSSKRYVITNPPDDFRLQPTDKVSILKGICFFSPHSPFFLFAIDTFFYTKSYTLYVIICLVESDETILFICCYILIIFVHNRVFLIWCQHC